MKRRSLHLLLGSILVIAGCLETDMPPAGSYSDVLVVTENGGQSAAARDLASVLGRELDFYVSRDVQFNLSHVRAADVEAVPYVKNIVVCGVAGPLTHVGRQIEFQLGEVALEKVRSGTANIFRKEGLPGPGQLTVIVTATSEEELHRVLIERGEEINRTIEQSCRQRLRRFLLKDPSRELTRTLKQKYGFNIEVPTLYRLHSDQLDPPGIELLREGPARLLGIFWLDWRTWPALKDSSRLFRARAQYVYERYDGDTMDSTRVKFSPARLGEYPAIKMEGYWSNSRSVAGGGYQCYFVYDETERLLWVVDLLVFAPGLPKHLHFRELLSLAETFRYN